MLFIIFKFLRLKCHKGICLMEKANGRAKETGKDFKLLSIAFGQFEKM